MKIYLLSLNLELKEHLKAQIALHGNRICYVSSAPQGSEKPYFNNSVNEFKRIHPNITLEYFDLSDSFSDKNLEKILEFEILYLSGGNTFNFLQSIRARGFEEIIKKFESKLIIGVSAGAIILTKSIAIAGIEDPNTIGMSNFQGLGFANFLFHPHLNQESDKFYKLKKFAERTKEKIYACTDSDGLFIEQGAVTVFGAPLEFN